MANGREPDIVISVRSDVRQFVQSMNVIQRASAGLKSALASIRAPAIGSESIRQAGQAATQASAGIGRMAGVSRTAASAAAVLTREETRLVAAAHAQGVAFEEAVSSVLAQRSAAISATGANRDLGRAAARAGRQASTAAGDVGILTSSLRALVQRIGITIAAYLTFRTAIRIGREIININRALESQRVLLRTMTGDAAKGAAAFRLITRFAAETPFEIKNLTDAFIRLRAFGFVPAEQDLRGLGNVAAAFQQDITTLGDAVVSAVNTSIEPIRQFGIQARISGNSMTVSFQGVTRTIPRTTAALAAFIAEQGRSGNLSRAMADQMDTLNGRISNLNDAVTLFVGKIGEAGLNKELKESLTLLTQLISESDDLAISMGQGLAGGVSVATEALRAAIPIIKAVADGIAVLTDPAAVAARPLLERVGDVEDVQGARRELREFGRQQAEIDDRIRRTRATIQKIEEEPRLGVPRLGLGQLKKDLDELLFAREMMDVAVEAAGEKLKSFRVSPDVVDPLKLPELDTKGISDPIRDAVQELRVARSVIADLQTVSLATGSRFNAAAAEAQAMASAIDGISSATDKAGNRLVGLTDRVAGLDARLVDLRARQRALEEAGVVFDVAADLRERLEAIDREAASYERLGLFYDRTGERAAALGEALDTLKEAKVDPSTLLAGLDVADSTPAGIERTVEALRRMDEALQALGVQEDAHVRTSDRLVAAIRSIDEALATGGIPAEEASRRFQAVVGSVRESVAEMTSGTKQLTAEAKAQIEELARAFEAEGFTAPAAEIRGLAATVGDTLGEEMSQVGRQAAEDLIVGFVEGTRSFGDLLRGVAATVFRSFVSRGLDVLFKKGSPSKVMIDYGRDLMGSLAKGIEEAAVPIPERLADLPDMPRIPEQRIQIRSVIDLPELDIPRLMEPRIRPIVEAPRMPALRGPQPRIRPAVDMPDLSRLSGLEMRPEFRLPEIDVRPVNLDRGLRMPGPREAFARTNMAPIDRKPMSNVYNINYAPTVQAWDARDTERAFRQNRDLMVGLVVEGLDKNRAAREKVSLSRR